MFITLHEPEIARLLDWGALIDSMEDALAAFSTGRVIQPVREILALEEGKRYFAAMPAIADGAMGAKLVSFFPANAERSLHTHFALIALFRTDTGEPLAALDGRLITEMRTAAVSAAVTRRIVPREKGRILALLGSGVQAKAHLEALAHLYRFEEVRVWSRTPANALAFAGAHGARATATAEEAVRGADVVVTATASMTPILKGAWLETGAHVNAVGAPRPTWREMDDAVMANTVIVDSRAAVEKESGDVILSRARIYAEAGEIFAGLARAPEGVTTVFKSVGLAVEDIATARLVYDAAARARGTGA